MRRFIFRWMGLALVFHLIAAWWSVGHHSADEYFQIIEFLNYKRGITPAVDLAVEFRERMRPWMQPFLYLQLVRAWEWLGVHNPFTWAWSFRLVTGLLGWAGCVGLAFRSREWFTDPKAQRFCVIALALMWFLPALHVRPSSESLSGSAFLAGLAILAATESRNAAMYGLGGALLGLSFEARFQTGFMIAGLLAWLVVIARAPARKMAWTIAGLALVFALGRWVDRWGYGEWVLSPWRYVDYNLLRGEVNHYGQAPIWDVFRMSFTESWPFLGLALAIASVVAWIRHPRHVLTWSFVPFFLVHEVIAHKELRFFFPIALAGPVLLTLSLTSARTGRFIDPDQAFPGWPGRLTRWFWRFLLVNNGVALLALLFVPFARPVLFYQSLYELIPRDAPRFEVFYRGTEPYHLMGNPVYFYRPPNLVTTEFHDYPEIVARLQAGPGQPLWLFDPGFNLPPEAAAIAPDCQPVIRTLPPWITHLNIGGWIERAHPWTLFRCQRG